MLRKTIFAFIAIFALTQITLATQVTLAGELEDKVKQAIELAKAGQPAEAQAAMEGATTILWLRSPLTVTRALFVTEKASGFGEYTKRPDNIYSTKGTVRVYTELTGYDWEKIGDRYKLNMVVDVSLKNPAGKILWSKKEFGVFRNSKPYQFKKLYINLSLGISGVQAGDYVIEFTLIDKRRNQTALISLPFKAQ